MFCVRPARFSDLADIERLANSSAARISTLPDERDKLSEKIEYSTKSFEGDSSTEGLERFLFVLENTETGQVLGTSGIDACAGNGGPFYNYRSDELIHSSHALKVHNRVPVLYLTHELTGKTLLCSFTIDPTLKDLGPFRLLSRARFLFMDAFRDRFRSKVITEVQGIQDKDGHSPFWDSVGRHFFNMDFATADYYSGVKSKTFIAELMPSHPIYVPLLTPEARAAMGKHHPATDNTVQLLLREGFRIAEHIDIFDGGPTFENELEGIQTIQSRSLKFAKPGGHNSGMKYLVANRSFTNFRCVIASLTDGLGDVIRVSDEVSKTLNINDGGQVAFVTL